MSHTLTRRVCPPRYATRLFCITAGAYIAGLFGRLSYAAVMADLIAQEGLGKAEAGPGHAFPNRGRQIGLVLAAHAAEELIYIMNDAVAHADSPR